MAHLSQNRISYTVSLSLLFAALLITLNLPDFIFSQAWIPLIALGSIIVLMIAARKFGRILMRNESYDSIWEFRWFFLVFWVLMLVLSIVIGVIRHSAADIGWSVLVALIVGLNVVGIIIHAKSRARLIKNIKKDELFQ